MKKNLIKRYAIIWGILDAADLVSISDISYSPQTLPEMNPEYRDRSKTWAVPGVVPMQNKTSIHHYCKNSRGKGGKENS